MILEAARVDRFPTPTSGGGPVGVWAAWPARAWEARGPRELLGAAPRALWPGPLAAKRTARGASCFKLFWSSASIPISWPFLLER